MIGIYKISSPSQRVYIGQSIDIARRWEDYKKLQCKNQTHLYNSFLKHGVENHTFEIIEECNLLDLNCRERYWQDHHNVLNGGLNCILTSCGDKGRVVTQSMKDKMSEGRKGKLIGKDNPMFGVQSPFYNKTHSNEVKTTLKSQKLGRNNPRARLLLDEQTGIFYETVKEAAEAIGIPYSRLKGYVRGTNPNKTSLIYC